LVGGTVSVGGTGAVEEPIKLGLAVATSSAPGVQAAKIARLNNKKRFINFREFTAYSPGHYRFLCKMSIAYDFAKSIAINADSYLDRSTYKCSTVNKRTLYRGL
jgi:hypothetical protein